ncbi:hypothetical protein C1H46_005979 [Malus baccata]|uniref:RRM domain-containing protein n=1 Tax=Malus baccata TaxID=106549 RepID=A0A540NBD9_MALBA|nr:hypothetical protein C1H46_005979 [Malus baccata]
MALSRLLLPQPWHHHHLPKTALPISTRWCSSSSSGAAEKSSGSENSKEKERRAAAADKSDNSKYMEMHNKVGGSWDALKDIFTNVKERMLGSPRFQKQRTIKAIDSASDRTVPEVIKTKNSPHDTANDQPNCSIRMPKITRDSHGFKENVSMSLRNDIIGECSSSEVHDATASKRVEVHKHIDKTAALNITRKISSKDMGQSKAKPKSHSKLEEVMSDNIGVLKSETEFQSCLTHQLPGEDSRILQKDVANGFTEVGNRNHQREKTTSIFDQTPTAGTDVGKMPASSKKVGLADMFMRTMNGQKDGKLASERKSDGSLASNGLLGVLNETNETTRDEEDMGKGFSINGLIGCIKELPRESLFDKPQNCAILNKSDDIIKNGGSVPKVPSLADSHKRDAKGKESSARGHAMGKGTNSVSGSEEQPCRETPPLTQTYSISESDSDDLKVASRKMSKQTQQFHLPTGKEGFERKVLVKFLPKNVKEGSVADVLRCCGDIVKIQLLPLIEGSNFRNAWVHFKTQEGLQKALGKTDLTVRNIDIFVEAASSRDVPNKVTVPKLIGDPKVPTALVKNPTRTVVIKQLTDDISSHHLKEALDFCGSAISGVFLGSSSSVAYVEFETEEAKEIAITAHTIRVQGKLLPIYRIDVPRTTVVRISNFDETVSLTHIQHICKSHGEIKRAKERSKGIVDVQFKLAEWPKMWTILNSLNGLRFEGHQLIAQPAPVFPPEVLQALWSQPDERIHVQSVLRRLIRDAELNVEITNIATKVYFD